MAVPANWSMVRLVGFLINDDGNPASSYSVTVQSSQTRLQDAVSHRVVFPEPDVLSPAVGDGYFWVDVVSDTDTDITPSGRQHKITLKQGATVLQTWFVTIDHATASQLRFDDTTQAIVTSGGTLRDAVWITSLQDFSDAPVVVGPGTGNLTNYFTKTETSAAVDAKMAAHLVAADPHTQYALDSDLAGKQPADPDLDALAAMDSTVPGVPATDGSGWLRKTYAQLRTALGLATIATSGKLADAADVTVSGAAVGRPVAVGHVTGGAADGFVVGSAVMPVLAEQAKVTTATPSVTVRQLLPVGTDSNAVAVQLPAIPATGDPIYVGIRWETGANAASFAAVGGDSVGAGSATTGTVPLLSETVILQGTPGGTVGTGRWRALAGMKPQTALDGRLLAPQLSVAANTARFLNKLTRGVEDVSLLYIGDSTGNGTDEHVYFEAQGLATRYPAYTVIYHLWDPTGGAAYDTGGAPAATTIATGTGSRTLHVWNCSVAGMYLDYTLGNRWAAAVVAPAPDLVIVSHGHNGGSYTNEATVRGWRGGLLMLTEPLLREHPHAGVVITLQNPETANTYQALRARAFEDVAAARGFGVIDVHQAFIDTGNATAYTKADGIHPTNSGDTPAPDGRTGSRLWADVVLAALTHSNTATPRSQPQTLLDLAAPQLLTNGDFAAFTSAVPDGWTVTGATTSKDTRAGYFDSTNGYAVRLQATGAAGSSMFADIASPASYAGQWVTLAVRMRVDAAQTGTAGRISLQDSSTTITLASSSAARDGLFWTFLPFKVAAGTTLLRTRIYADSAATSTADVTIDRVWLVRGAWPLRASAGAVGATGPAGTTKGQPNYLSTFGTHPATGAMGGGTYTLAAANGGVAVQIKPFRDMTIAFLEWICGVQSGNYDIAILDAAGNRLWSKGSTAWPATGLVIETVSPTVALTADSIYYLMHAGDNTTGSIRGTTLTNADQSRLLDGSYAFRSIGSTMPIGAAVTLGSSGSSRVPLIVCRET